MDRKLINIGSVIEEQLEQVGIDSYEKLKKEGSKNAWLKVKKIDPSSCLVKLYAIEGAIENIAYNKLADKTKKELKDFFNNHK